MSDGEDPSDDEELSLEDVRALGGDENDFTFLQQKGTRSSGGNADIAKLQHEVAAFMKREKIPQKPAVSNVDRVKASTDNSSKRESKLSSLQDEVKTFVTKELHNEDSDDGEVDAVALDDLDSGAAKEMVLKLVKSGGSGEKWWDWTPTSVQQRGSRKPDVKTLRGRAQQILKARSEAYEATIKSKGSTDQKYLRTVVRTGTLTDRMAAMTLIVQECPLLAQKALQTLTAMAKKTGKRESELALDAMKELYVRFLLPDRKLLFIHEQSLAEGTPSDDLLAKWAFEEAVKTMYAEYVVALERASHSNQIHLKSTVLKTTFQLLANKPENEKMLLAALANKLGDQEKKLASKAVYLLRELVDMHPNMKGAVIREVHQLLHRPNVSDRAQYYATVFLNQILLTRGEHSVAEALVAIYFGVFKTIVVKKNVDARILSALLTGINRAFPYAQLDQEVYEQHVDSLFRMTHVANFNTCVQALTLLFQVMSSRGVASDRFYRSLYGTLLSPELRHSSKQGLFLNLLYKALKADVEVNRIKAFAKRLLQTCVYAPAPYICGALFLLSEVIKAHPSVQSMVSQREEYWSEDELNDVRRQQSANVDAAEGSHPAKDTSTHAQYDSMKREPQYAAAEKTCLWELVDLARHFHPSVVKFAQCLLLGQAIQYDGDPLKDLTLSAFLERFVFKNPKKKQQIRGSHMRTIEQVVPERMRLHPVNSAAFLAKGQQNIKPEEMFFYEYFMNRKQKKPKNKKEKETEEEEVADEEADAFLRSLAAGEGEEEDDEEFNYSDEDEQSDDEPFVYDAVEGSDDEADDGSREGLPSGLDFSEMDGIGLAGSAEEDVQEDDETAAPKRKKLKLPKYADADEYAKLLLDDGATKADNDDQQTDDDSDGVELLMDGDDEQPHSKAHGKRRPASNKPSNMHGTKSSKTLQASKRQKRK